MFVGPKTDFLRKSDDDVPTTLESDQAPIPIAPRDKIRRSGKPLTPIIDPPPPPRSGYEGGPITGI